MRREFLFLCAGESQMNLNFFQWIREGVRHSVLAGVSDAVNQMGETPHNDNLSARLGDYLRSNQQQEESTPRVGTDNKSRKRLGRSLKEIAPQRGE
jgi:hypothetical protein